MTKTDVENIGHALSTVIQTRYVWLFNHISRVILFDIIDNREYDLPSSYSFSKDDEEKGNKPLEVRFIVDLLRKNDDIVAYSDDGRSFNYEFNRKITIISLRASLLANVQSYLEFYKIIDICKRNGLDEVSLFDFILQARNIVCHANGIMNSSRLRFCQWRDLIIENNGQQLKISDFLLLELVNEAIEKLAEIYVNNGAEIDYISLNLGYSIPYIRQYMNEHKK